MSDNLPPTAMLDTAAEKVSFLQSAHSSAIKKNGASNQSFSCALRDAHESHQLFEDGAVGLSKTELASLDNDQNSPLIQQYGNELPIWGKLTLAISSSSTKDGLSSTEFANVEIFTTDPALVSSSSSTLGAISPTGNIAIGAASDIPQINNTAVLVSAAVTAPLISTTGVNLAYTTAVTAQQPPSGTDASSTAFTSVTNHAISPAHQNFTSSASHSLSEAHPSQTISTDNVDDLLNATPVVNASVASEKPSLVPIGMASIPLPLSVIAPRYGPIRSESSILPARILDQKTSPIITLAQNNALIESPSNTSGSQFASGATLWNNLMGQSAAQGQNSETNKLSGVEAATVPTVDSLLEETPLISSSSLTRTEESGLPKSFFQLAGKLDSPLLGQELAQKVQVLLQNNLQQVQLQVNPKHLGLVDISIVMSQDQQVSVTFHVQNAQIKDAIDAAMPRLKEMLEQQGLNLTNTDVSHQSKQEKTSDRGSPLSREQERGDFSPDDDQSAHQVEGYYLNEPSGRLDLFA